MSCFEMEAKVLEDYTRAVIHMRSQFKRKRLSLVFGAGISLSLGFPKWEDLVKRIGCNPRIQGQTIADNSEGRSLESISEMLFQHFKTNWIKTEDTKSHLSAYEEKKMLADWRDIIHDCLYREAPNLVEKIKNHPYLKAYVGVMKNSEMTVNYNFDDSLERLLALNKSEDDTESGLNNESVWNPYVQARPGQAMIYHPNGFLPEDKHARQSETLVFSDESFADQLLGSMRGNLSSLVHLFTKNTCMLIGLSLTDNTLRHLLRQSAQISPGNFHYYIAYVDKNAPPLDASQKSAIVESNFNVYNLITLFLDDEQIAALGGLIGKASEDFMIMSEQLGVETKYCYYLVGAVGTGKTTALSSLGSLSTYNEWIDDRIGLLSVHPNELSKEEELQVNQWVNRQFMKKNWELHKKEEGIYVIDRSPVDPLAYVKEDKNKAKRAKSLISAIRPGKSNTPVQPGQVILLTAKTDDLRTRILGKRKHWDTDELKNLQERTDKLYDGPGIKKIDTHNRSIDAVVRDISRMIHLDVYKPADLEKRLMEISNFC